MCPPHISLPNAAALTDHVPADHTAQLTGLDKRYLNALLQGARETAATLIDEALAAGVSIRDIYLHVFQPSQYEVGRLWQEGQISVAQEHFCTAATQMIMAQLYPQIFGSARNGRALVAACADKERHEMGVRMVADFFEMEGWDTYYLGTDVAATTIIDTLLERNANLLALSATMPSGLDTTATLIQSLRAEPRIQHIPILVGGFAFRSTAANSRTWQEIGADAYAPDALTALTVATTLLEAQSA